MTDGKWIAEMHSHLASVAGLWVLLSKSVMDGEQNVELYDSVWDHSRKLYEDLDSLKQESSQKPHTLAYADNSLAIFDGYYYAGMVSANPPEIEPKILSAARRDESGVIDCNIATAVASEESLRHLTVWRDRLEQMDITPILGEWCSNPEQNTHDAAKLP